MKLLTRDQFRSQALARDYNKCVVCGSTLELSVHHILERKLFSDGGYYLDNAATLCETCHLKAEDTSLTVEEIRKLVGIKNCLLPLGFSKEKTYDKWGNEICEGYRIPGPMFYDIGAQRSLASILHLFIKQSPKYPRTYHLPFSPGATSDDKILISWEQFKGPPIVITEKMDGSNVCLESDACFARTHSGPPDHPSFDMLKAFHAGVKHLIPENFQIFGEWLYAKHSIEYGNLPNYLMIFGVRDLKTNVWGSWEEVYDWAVELGVTTVPELFCGNTNDLMTLVLKLAKEQSSYSEQREGVVVRYAWGFPDEEFSDKVCKWVKAGLITSNEHWKHQEIIRNRLAH